jgi:hypothetical protein
MKNIAACFLISICSLTEIAGQSLSTVDSNKYSIDLPEYWKPGNRVWKILTDKLPLVCNEIKDKELCGDNCNPLYRLELEMSDPVIYEYFPNHISSVYTNTLSTRPSETWEIQTMYGFECSLLLRNNKGEIVTRFILVDTNETWKVSKRVTLASYSPPPIPANFTRRIRSSRYSSIDPSPPDQPIYPIFSQEGETPYSFIYRNKESLIPSIRDMYSMVDMKFNSW